MKPINAEGGTVGCSGLVGLLESIAGECFQQTMLGGTTRERKLSALLSEAAAEIQKLRNALDHYAHGGSNYGRIARDALGMEPNTELSRGPASGGDFG